MIKCFKSLKYSSIPKRRFSKDFVIGAPLKSGNKKLKEIKEYPKKLTITFQCIVKSSSRNSKILKWRLRVLWFSKKQQNQKRVIKISNVMPQEYFYFEN